MFEIHTLLTSVSNAACAVLVFCAALQLEVRLRSSLSHSPVWWRELWLPLGGAFLFALHAHGAGEGFVFWLALLAPCGLAAGLLRHWGFGSERLIAPATKLGSVLFVPALALLLFV